MLVLVLLSKLVFRRSLKFWLSVTALLLLLNIGGRKYAELSDRCHCLCLVLSDEDLQKGEEFGTKSLRLKHSLRAEVKREEFRVKSLSFFASPWNV